MGKDAASAAGVKRSVLKSSPSRSQDPERLRKEDRKKEGRNSDDEELAESLKLQARLAVDDAMGESGVEAGKPQRHAEDLDEVELREVRAGLDRLMGQHRRLDKFALEQIHQAQLPAARRSIILGNLADREEWRQMTMQEQKVRGHGSHQEGGDRGGSDHRRQHKRPCRGGGAREPGPCGGNGTQA